MKPTRSRIAQGLIAGVCLIGFYVGLRSTKQTNQTTARPPSPLLSENLQRTSVSSLGNADDWFAQLRQAAIDQDQQALAHLRKEDSKHLTPSQLKTVVGLIDKETDSFL